MNEITFTYSCRFGALKLRTDPGRIRAEGGPLYPRIIVTCDIESVPQETLREAWLLQVQVGLDVPGKGRIADSLPVQINRQVYGTGHPIFGTVSVEFPIDLHRAQAIEASRQGDMSLSITLHWRLGYVAFWKRGASDVHDGDEVGTAYEPLQMTIPQSEWVKNVLPGLGLGTVMLVEVPINGIERSPELVNAVKALDDARDRLKVGLYDDAARQCRIALEPFFEQVDKPDGAGKMPQLKKSWEVKLGQAAYQWLGESVNAIKWAANPVHHSPTARFGRLDTEMLVMVTTALVSYAARTLKN
ncbi:MAG: hypothetical protein AB1813_18175 [Verrucomicrobiota bacterium]